MELSVVIPYYNEEESVRELHRRVKAVCEEAALRDYEIVLVTDGSSYFANDRSGLALKSSKTE